MINIHIDALKGEGSRLSFIKLLISLVAERSTWKIYVIDRSYEFMYKFTEISGTAKEENLELPNHQIILLHNENYSIDELSLLVDEAIQQINDEKITVFSFRCQPDNDMADDLIQELTKALEKITRPDCYRQTYCLVHEWSREWRVVNN